MIQKLTYSTVFLSTLMPQVAQAQAQCTGVKAVGGTCTSGALTSSFNAIINTIFYIIGAIAVLFLLIGAIRYITSTGDAARIKQAKDTIFYALAGLIIAIVARAIVAFVITRISA